MGWAGLAGLGAVAALISIHCEVFVSALEPGDGEVVCCLRGVALNISIYLDDCINLYIIVQLYKGVT